jgi:hypothetical protein
MHTEFQQTPQLNDSLFDLEKTLSIYAPALSNKLEEGAEEARVADRLATVNVHDEELVQLYSWKNGMTNAWQYKITEYDICSFGKFMSLDPTVSLYLALKAARTTSKLLFPVITNLAGDYLFYDANKKSKSHGMLLIYSPAILVTKPLTAFDSLGGFFKCISKCYEHGIYKFNEGTGQLKIDFPQEHELCKLANPRSRFWHT